MNHHPLFRALGLGAALTLGVVACSSSSSGTSKHPGSTTAPEQRLVAKPGFVNVVSVSGAHDLPAADQQAIVDNVAAYVQAATIDPLHGKPTTGLAKLFVPTALPAITGPERVTLVDADLPATKGPVTTKLGPVSLHGLADGTGAIDLIGAGIDLTVAARSARGPITIHRTGELMFERDTGGWKILGFQLAVTRDGTGLDVGTTSTTTKVGS